MRATSLLLVAAAVGLCAWAVRVDTRPAPAPTKLLIVRHADRDGERDALTDKGMARADALVHVAANAGVSGIYCTKTERTRKTAEPLAKKLGIAAVELDPRDVDGLLEHVLKHHRGGTVLIVGHSNTLPKIIANVGGPKIPDLAEGDFDDLFVVSVVDGTLGPGGIVPGVVHLQYGAATP